MTNDLAVKISHAFGTALYGIQILSVGEDSVRSRDLMTLIDTANKKIIELCDAEIKAIKARKDAPDPMLAILEV